MPIVSKCPGVTVSRFAHGLRFASSTAWPSRCHDESRPMGPFNGRPATPATDSADGRVRSASMTRV